MGGNSSFPEYTRYTFVLTLAENKCIRNGNSKNLQKYTIRLSCICLHANIQNWKQDNVIIS